MVSIVITIGGRLTTELHSEDQLLGCICSYLSIMDVFQDIPDLEITARTQFTRLPINLISVKESLDELQVIYNNLQKITGDSIQVIPLGLAGPILTAKSFNINPNDGNDFIDGYYMMPQMINAYFSRGNSVYSTIRDEFSPQPEFINRAKLINTPNNTPSVSDFKFHLKVPSYVWVIPKEDDIYLEQITTNLINLFLRDCSETDHNLLKTKDYYLRFLQYQDGPDTQRYVYGYLRQISNCTYSSHMKILRSCPDKYLPCEINTSTKGYFFMFPETEWMNNNVTHITMFD